MNDDAAMTQWQRIMEETRRYLSAWRDAHPRATFAEIEDAVEERLDALRGELITDIVTERAAAAADGATRPGCPVCERSMVRRGSGERTVTVRGNRTVPLQRAYFACPVCDAGLFPPG